MSVTPQAEARPSRFDGRLRISLVAVAVSGAVLTFCALLASGVSAALSVGMGALLATGNLWVLARIVAALLPDEQSAPEATKNRGGWALLAVLKMVGLLGAAWLLMRHGVVSPLPMLIGFGSLPIGIAIGSIVSDRSAP